ncbi:hypothetical protein ALO42_100537 [Pseudomonas syringae pv. atrofaciens]|nr:hypothetical protein ALO42_100537 [Pseudomonas syringae pv. atrofaciens]
MIFLGGIRREAQRSKQACRQQTEETRLLHVEKSPVVKKGGQEQRDTTGVPVSRAFVPPCNLYWRSPTLGPATCLAASRNPSRLLQIVVPRTCVDSCTSLIKRELCQLVLRLVFQGLAESSTASCRRNCLVLVRDRTVMRQRWMKCFVVCL